ncbi:MAG: hypothetical protein C0594_06495 [Marinilabiliales bacterium]|nr:MAG: hypothetical protein C0594_06495 [Marinilabiliales bacterium]
MKKKSNKANLENKRLIFFQLGLILSLLIVFTAFEWVSPLNNSFVLEPPGYNMEPEEDMVNTAREKEVIKPKPKITELKIVETIKDDEPEMDVSVLDENIEEPLEIITNIDLDIEEPPADPVPWAEIKVKPMFPGGEKAMMKFLQDNVRFPSHILEMAGTGKVFVKFVIDEKGKVKDAIVLRGLDPLVDKEVLRVVNIMPDWTPGEQFTKKVPVEFVLPIVIQ